MNRSGESAKGSVYEGLFQGLWILWETVSLDKLPRGHTWTPATLSPGTTSELWGPFAPVASSLNQEEHLSHADLASLGPSCGGRADPHHGSSRWPGNTVSLAQEPHDEAE